MKQHTYIYIFLVILAFLWNAFMCTMSPLRDVLFSADANCFYMGGKCMAHGMVPYVDFVDTKGPLLFFLYMIGYLISPDETWGAYIVLSCFTFFTLALLYKLASLFDPDTHRPILVVAICTIFLFYHETYGYGGRAEQFLLPFIAWLIYASCKLSMVPENLHNWRQFALSVGVCSAAIVLTKFNYIIYPASSVFLSYFLLYKQYNKRKVLLIVGKYILTSFILCILPFLLYLIYTGATTEFIDVYFRQSSANAMPEYTNFLNALLFFQKNLRNWLSNSEVYWCFFSIIFLYTQFYTKKICKNGADFLFFSFLSLIFCSCLGLYRYYSLLFMPLTIFMIVPIMQQLKYSKLALYAVIFLTTVWGIHTNYFKPRDAHAAKFKKAYPESSKDYSKLLTYISSVPQPKILYIDGLGLGFSIKTKAMPACPTWFYLNGADKKLFTSAYNAVEQRIADFVISRPNSENKDLLQKSGYRIITEFPDGEQSDSTWFLWCRGDINLQT